MPAGGRGVSLSRQDVQVVTLALADHPRPDIPPQQDAVIGRLPAATGIERGPVQNDALIGVSEQHSLGRPHRALGLTPRQSLLGSGTRSR